MWFSHSFVIKVFISISEENAALGGLNSGKEIDSDLVIKIQMWPPVLASWSNALAIQLITLVIAKAFQIMFV